MIYKILGLVMMMPPLLFMLAVSIHHIKDEVYKKNFNKIFNIFFYVYLIELFCNGLYFLFK